MKKLILPLSFALLGFTGFASNASAQRYAEPVIEARVDGPRISVGRADDRDWGRGRGYVAQDLNRLNLEVRQVREEIRAAGGGGRRVRAMFSDVLRGTDRLNAQFERRARTPSEIRRRADELRGQLSLIRRELRVRDVRRSGDWR